MDYNLLDKTRTLETPRYKSTLKSVTRRHSTPLHWQAKGQIGKSREKTTNGQDHQQVKVR